MHPLASDHAGSPDAAGRPAAAQDDPQLSFIAYSVIAYTVFRGKATDLDYG